MILGCGIDIEALSRFEKYLNDWQKHQSFFFMVYSQDEIDRCRQYKPEISFPLCFCCKEAGFKALGQTPFTADLNWSDVELRFDPKKGFSNCKVQLSGNARNIFRKRGGSRILPQFEIIEGHIIFTILLVS